MSGSIILFDGVCNLCNASVKFIIKHDPGKRFQFAAIQSEIAKEMLKGRNHSITNPESLILIENYQMHQRSTAVLKIARNLNGLFRVFYVFIIIPRPIRDFFYDLIARNRYHIFGKKDRCMIPEQDIENRFVE